MPIRRSIPILIALLAVAVTLSVTSGHTRAAPNSGVVGTGTPASCTEAALTTALAGGGNITFNCGANPHTIMLTSGKTITSDTTLDGGNQIILSGGDAAKVFTVNAGARLTLNNLTVAHGNSGLGGCVTVQGTLHATHTTFQNCASHTVGFFAGSGGAIFSWGGTLALTDSVVMNNHVDLDGGGLYLLGGQTTLVHVDVLSNTATVTETGSGGGIYVAANTAFVASDSHFSHNSIGWQGQGGGLYVYSSTALLLNVSTDYNHASGAGDGGGVYAENSQLTWQGGSATSNTGLSKGGGLALDGSTVNLNAVQIASNKAGHGGGIQTFGGTLAMNNAKINGNIVTSDGGGLDLANTPTTLISSTITNNHGERNGGGIHNYQGALVLDRVTVSGNEALDIQGDGGGIYNDRSVLNATNSTIDHNTTSGDGGGLFNATDSTLNLTNVTVSGNRASTKGGGFYNQTNVSIADQTYITLTNVTVKDNLAVTGGGLWNGSHANNLVYLKNTVLADNAGNCSGKAPTSARYSLSTDSSCTLSGPGNLTNTPAGLFPLMDNGGSTKTHLPSYTSFLVGGVNSLDLPLFDQRGISRPQGLAGDIGAVERTLADPLVAPWLYVPLIKR